MRIQGSRGEWGTLLALLWAATSSHTAIATGYKGGIPAMMSPLIAELVHCNLYFKSLKRVLNQTKTETPGSMCQTHFKMQLAFTVQGQGSNPTPLTHTEHHMLFSPGFVFLLFIVKAKQANEG